MLGGDHATQQRCRGLARLAVLGVEGIEDGQAGVESDEVNREKNAELTSSARL